MKEKDIFYKNWNACKEKMHGIFNENEYNQWIKNLDIDIEDDLSTINIRTKNRYSLEIIRKNYLKTIKELIEEANQKYYDIQLTHKKTERKNKTITSETITPKTPKKPANNTSKTLDKRMQLNPLYTFENLVEGSENRVAHAAGIYIANDTGNQYNPLYIHGGVGLGKTHLLHAIGNTFKENTPDKKVICINAEQFTRDISKAARTKTFEKFQSFYRNADLLLIDDVQFFSSKEKSQEEFYNLFNNLLEKNSRIVMSSDTYPKQLEEIPERLKSRFSSGITLEIEPPKLEMRINILHSKASLQEIDLPEEVAFFIAKNIRTNVRELEGAFNSVVAYVNFNECDINIESTKEALKNHIVLINRQISVDYIQKTVSDYYRVSLSEIYSKSRKANIVKARQVAMYLSKELTKKSLQDIADKFGSKDHTNVLYAVKQIRKKIKEDSNLKREVKHLEQTLNI